MLSEHYCSITLPFSFSAEDDFMFSKLFRSAEKIENKVKYFVKKQYYEMRKTKEYKKWLNRYIHPKNNKEKVLAKKRLNKLTIKYQLTKTLIEKYAAKQKLAYNGCIQSQMIQLLADNVYKSLEKIMYSDGKKFHFKKPGDLYTIRTKANNNGFRFDNNTLTVKYKSKTYKLIINKDDYYAYELLSLTPAYTALIRKPFKNGYKYYFQITFKDKSPIKRKMGSGSVGIDIGTSTIAVVGKDLIFEPLAPGIDKYNKQIIKLQTKLNHSRFINNPNNFNKDGTIKKGVKLNWYKTKTYTKLLFKLKNAYRKREAYKKTYINNLTNRILKLGDTFIIEDMNFKALQKKSKTTERSDKVSEIKQKDGTVKQVNKFKKKKRFGKSLNNHSPALVITILNNKIKSASGISIKINTKNYKASQYNHVSDEYIKTELNQRVKYIGTDLVQRDLYSAFLLKNYKDLDTVDKDKCSLEFSDFINKQNKIIDNLNNNKEVKKYPSCMGIKEFIKIKNSGEATVNK